MGVCKYDSNVLFVNQGDVFFGLAEFCVGECSEDIETGFCFGVYVVYVGGEFHFVVICHFECGGRNDVGYGCVVKSYGWL